MKQIARIATITLALALFLSALPAIADSPSGVVNINTAALEELTLLPRVGPAVAQRILDLREENGPFKSVEDLMLVRGVGERTFELIEPYVTLNGQTTLQEKVRVPRAAASDERE